MYRTNVCLVVKYAYEPSYNSMQNCISFSFKYKKSGFTAFYQLSQYLSDNYMTEFWEICVIMIMK